MAVFMKHASWMEFSILIRDIDALRKTDTSRSSPDWFQIISNHRRKNLTVPHLKGPVQSPAGVSPFLCHRNVTVNRPPPFSEQHSSLDTIVLTFIFTFKLLRGRGIWKLTDG